MDGNLNMRNWGYYDLPSSFRGHLGLQVVPEKPLIGGREAAALGGANEPFQYRDSRVSQSSSGMDYVRDAWVYNNRERFMNVVTGSPNFGELAGPSTASYHMEMIQQSELSKDESGVPADEAGSEKESIAPMKKKRSSKVQKSPKLKKAKKASGKPEEESSPLTNQAKGARKNIGVVINGIDMDISGIPIPVCSCTGVSQQCYRWGSGGWQSACCTTAMSVYPLPMSGKRKGSRIAGRKMSIGAFKKVLEKLSAEGYNFTDPIDLRTHWAKHGTNKFVTIR